MTTILALAALLVVWWLLLKARLAPVLLMRLWFFFVNVVTIFPLSALTWMCDVVLQAVRAPHHWTQCMSIVVLTTAFRIVCWLNPQITMTVNFGCRRDGTSRLEYADLHNGAAIVANHTSFWDVSVGLASLPLKSLLNTRTFVKASLKDIPIFGSTFDRVGQFPVYFKSDEDGNFHMDKEKQAEVQKIVDAHLARGGNLALFPEGQLNKHPEKLQPFRYGTFTTILEHRMQLFFAVFVGNEKVWPIHTIMGGYPADTYVCVGEYIIEDYEKHGAKQVAEALQERMQEVYSMMVQDLKAGRVPLCRW